MGQTRGTRTTAEPTPEPTEPRGKPRGRPAADSDQEAAPCEPAALAGMVNRDDRNRCHRRRTSGGRGGAGPATGTVESQYEI